MHEWYQYLPEQEDEEISTSDQCELAKVEALREIAKILQDIVLNLPSPWQGGPK